MAWTDFGTKANNEGTLVVGKKVTTGGGIDDGNLADGLVPVVIAVAADGSASAGVTSSDSQTRPNDTVAYTSGDVIGSDTAAGGAVWEFTGLAPTGGGDVLVVSAELEVDVSSIPSGQTYFTLYLYNVTPPSALGDNAAFDLASADRAAFIGKLNLGAPVDEGSTCYVRVDGLNSQIKLSGTSAFGYLVTATGFTPTASSVRKVTLHAIRL